jgi:uncharacterized protein (DUF4415 family)
MCRDSLDTPKPKSRRIISMRHACASEEKLCSADWVDPDDAPPLTKEMLDQAEVSDGNHFVGPGRGRPKLASPKEQINRRLDTDVSERRRANRSGWQTRINEILLVSLGLANAT